tara:strand:+ start:793 stop:1167 length:375 start_codon:yes stop_codon:yes gene_type:complete
MSVTRISNKSLDKILSGEIKENSTCVLKFYSNDCHLCHALSEYFTDISEEDAYSDLHFLACNVADCPDIEEKMKFNGVPTIFVIHTNVGNRKPTLRLLPEPEKPNQKTWYKVSDIKNFINKEAL